MTDASANEPGIFEIMHTTRSMRRLKPDPVPNALIRRILEAGVSAANGGNMQRWRFLVVRDPTVKQTVAAYYRRAWKEDAVPRYRAGAPARLEGAAPTRSTGSSIYPAVQNMLLAARALRLGATLTTLHLRFEKETEAALGLPPDVHSYALLPIGYPMGRFGPVARAPLADFVYQDRWGEPSRDL